MEQSTGVFRQARSEIGRILLFVGGFSLCINLLMLVGPMYMLQVYDRVLPSRSLPTLFFLTLAAVGLIFVSALLDAIRGRVLVRLSGRFDQLLCGPLFARLHQAALFGRTQAQPLRDLETVRTFITGSGLFFFFDAPWSPVFLAFVFVLHPLLFAVALAGAIILFTLAVVTEIATRKPLTEASAHMTVATQFAQTLLRNADAVEAMGMLGGLHQRWLQSHHRGLARQAHASDRAGLLVSAAKYVRLVLQVAMLGTGAYLVLAGEITAGSMIAASIIMGRALAPIEGAIGNWRSFVLARRSLTRVIALLNSPGRKASSLPLPAPHGRIAVERLVGVPPSSDKVVVKGISFRIEAGDALGIVGPSAAGKSTLARLLVGAWLPASGHVRLDGVDIGDWNHEELGRHVGYLPQAVELFDGTIAENIARFTSPDPAAVIEAAQRAGAHDMILRLPEGYDTRIGPTVLSGGQRQRVALARAIYRDPVFIVLDEPNTNLDSEGEQALSWMLADRRRAGATIVVVAHRPSILDTVDKLMVLRDGMIELFAPREDVIAELTGTARPIPPLAPIPQVVRSGFIRA